MRTSGLEPYPEVKESGIPWLREIPTHWEVAPLRHLTTCLDGVRVPLEASVREKMLGPYPYWGANQIIDHVNDYILDEDLVLLGEDGAPFLDRTSPVAFYSQGRIWPNNHIHVLRPREPSRPEFLVYALNCVDYGHFVGGATRDKLTQGRMKSIAIPVPPVSEQIAIVRYLDHADRNIRHYILDKQKLIALLREQAQVIIHEAVTGQIDVSTGEPYPSYKASGVEWLKKIPDHWEMVRNGRLFAQRNEI